MAAPLRSEWPSFASPWSDDQVDLLRWLGFLHLDHGDADKATIIFDGLLVFFPDDLQLRLSLACALLKSGRAGDALQALDDLPDVGSSSVLSASRPALFHLLRSQALVQLDRKAEAARSMRHFLRLRRAARPVGRLAGK